LVDSTSDMTLSTSISRSVSFWSGWAMSGPEGERRRRRPSPARPRPPGPGLQVGNPHARGFRGRSLLGQVFRVEMGPQDEPAIGCWRQLNWGVATSTGTSQGTPSASITPWSMAWRSVTSIRTLLDDQHGSQACRPVPVTGRSG
jgi:hypothetical protein